MSAVRVLLARLVEADMAYDAALDAYHDALPCGLGARMDLPEDHATVVALRTAADQRRAALTRAEAAL